MIIYDFLSRFKSKLNKIFWKCFPNSHLEISLLIIVLAIKVIQITKLVVLKKIKTYDFLYFFCITLGKSYG